MLRILRCPACGENDLEVLERTEERAEIRRGELECPGCSRRFAVDKGIIGMLADPSEEILLEIEGWSAKINLDEYGPDSHAHARAWTLALPWLPEDLETSEEDRKAWSINGSSFEKFVLSEDLSRMTVLDIGAGRCWTSAAMAQKGAEVVALDTLTKLYVGLETADVFMEERGIYFERVQGDMHALPFRDSVFDMVFVTATAHHSQDFGRFSSEVLRVLKDDGRFVLINEPIAWRGDDPPEEAGEGITENMIGAGSWFRLFEKGGLTPVRSQVVDGRILSCGLRKRRSDAPASEKLLTWRHGIPVICSSHYHLALEHGRGFYPRLKSFVKRITAPRETEG